MAMSWEDPKVWETDKVVESPPGKLPPSPVEVWMAGAHATRSMSRLEVVIVAAIVFGAGVFVVWVVSTVLTLIGGAL